jgi:alpha-mannosidase
VLVTALGANPDGPGTVLRLWEMAGITGERTVRLPAGLSAKAVQPVDLRGQPLGQPVVVQDGKFSVSLSAFAPASFVIPPGH